MTSYWGVGGRYPYPYLCPPPRLHSPRRADTAPAATADNNDDDNEKGEGKEEEEEEGGEEEGEREEEEKALPTRVYSRPKQH